MVVSRGDIVLVNFPFTDLSQTKLRPAVVLWASSTDSDVTLCAITSQNVNKLTSGEFLRAQSDPEFSDTGLRVLSKVRVNRIITLSRQLVVRRLGGLGIQYIQVLKTTMIQVFQLN